MAVEFTLWCELHEVEGPYLRLRGDRLVGGEPEGEAAGEVNEFMAEHQWCRPALRNLAGR